MALQRFLVDKTPRAPLLRGAPVAMIYKLEIENFFSIKSRQVIDLRPSGKVRDTSRYGPIWPGSRERSPKVVTVFGANASGKSTVLKALAFASYVVASSFSGRPDIALPFLKFFDAGSQSNPTFIAIELGGILPPIEAALPSFARYRYELTLGFDSRHYDIASERLFAWPADTGRRVTLFDRDRDGKVSGSKIFKLGAHKQVLEKILRPNASVISTLAQLKHDFSLVLAQSAGSVQSNILIHRADGPDDGTVARHYANRADLLRQLNSEIAKIDVGITSVTINSGMQGPQLDFHHLGANRPTPMIFESHGTRSFVRFFPSILSALQTGSIAILDELDASIHPMILQEVFRWFRDRNPENAQLWTTCHNAGLLDDLAKEEVLLTEKDHHGRTSLFRLADIEGTRRDANYYRKYLSGEYGAVPRIG